MQSLTVVIPVLNDRAELDRLLRQIGPLLERSGVPQCEVLVVDGGSTDDSSTVALARGARIVCAPTGRGVQLQAGCRAARGDWLWLLHADSRVDGAPVAYLGGLSRASWGRFDVRFSGRHPLLRAIAVTMNMRSRLTGICTGDQGVFVHRSLLEAVGGVPAQPIMEDIELSKRLRRQMWPECPLVTLTTSSRRWESRGIFRTVASMWWLRLRYWLGADPTRLATEYYAS